MNLDVKEFILRMLDKKKSIKAADVARLCGFSKAYVNRSLQELREEGKIALFGKANRAHYIRVKDQSAVDRARSDIKTIHRVLKNAGLSEDIVLDEIKKSTGIFPELPANISSILGYGFTEMLNNAIEHSGARRVEIKMARDDESVRFDVADAGVGIFNNIIQKKHLKDEMEAIQEILKGKQTTMPAGHSGEGIFFTSRAADILTIKSSGKKIVFDNLIKDVFIRNVRTVTGTKVTFVINTSSDRTLKDIFDKYADDSFAFNKTEVKVKLFKGGTEYISRSQGRRIVSGLDKFKTIVLDFDGIETVGQGFADEVFRVWQANNPGIGVTYKNANDNVKFMIERAKKP
ncbi:MAG: DUF4325 domain-containing protein [Candidatus Omnitrophota bacterium]